MTGSVGGAVTGREAVAAIEDRVNDLLLRTVYRNRYWQRLLGDEPVPDMVLHGTALENYHFLRRESWFDSPALVFPGNEAVRRLLDEFYVAEHGHDELLMAAICSLGHARRDVLESVPLPSTMALCNALAWWARTDPLFFAATLGVLEGRDNQADSFLAACERQGLDEEFVGPIRKHSRINMAGQHGNLTRAVFFAVPTVPAPVLARILDQLRVFVELYDVFYASLWDHYSTATELLRPAARYWEEAGSWRA